MKKNLSITLLCLFVAVRLVAQDGRLFVPTVSEQEQIDSLKKENGNKIDTFQLRLKSAYSWKIDPRYGLRYQAEKDTARVNFHQSTLTDSKDVFVAYQGNLGSASQSQIYFNRPLPSKFVFQDGFRYWRKMPTDHLFFNTKIPYSNIQYQTGGGAQNKEERFSAELSSNFGKKINVGFDFDYVYTRGFYQNLHNKQVSYDFYGSYIGDNYKMHAFFSNNNFNNVENGGIAASDAGYITKPNDQINFSKKSMDIPVRFKDDLWNRLRGRNLFISNRYDIGDTYEQVQGTDSIMRWRQKKDYIAPVSLILTTHYSDQRRLIKSNSDEISALYVPMELVNGDWKIKNRRSDSPINDFMSYYSLKNTFAIAMNEGFRPWMKFGLSAFVEYDARKYLMPDSLSVGRKQNDDALFIGGELSSQKGKHIRFKVRAAKDLLNSDLILEGDLKTEFTLKGRPFTVGANAYLKKLKPSFFENNFSSKYWTWSKSFDDTERYYIGGEIASPRTHTKISGGFENIKNAIYYAPYDGILGGGGRPLIQNALPNQFSKSAQVISLRLDQDFHFGKFHWENQLVFQHSSDESVIPLPKISAYTNMYLLTHIAKVLTLQIGVDARFHTKYYAPGYEPLTMQFYNQNERKIGNFPLTTVYLNLHLKYTRFFVMMYNLAEGMGNSDYFSLHGYPLNPRIVKFGLAWSFNN